MGFSVLLLLLGLYLTVSGSDECREGQHRTDDGCQDIDECETYPDICGPNTMCKNEDPHFSCSCSPGYQSSNGKETFHSDEGVTCVYINTCKSNPKICGSNAKCYNVRHSYNCRCDPGYSLKSGLTEFTAPNVSCEDINECEKDKNICGAGGGGTCNNENGTYQCLCPDGFSRYGKRQGRCVDLNCGLLNVDNSTLELPAELREIFSLMLNNCQVLSTNRGDNPNGEMLLEKLLVILDMLMSHGAVKNNAVVSKMLHLVEVSTRMIAPLLVQPRTQKAFEHIEVDFLLSRDGVSPQGPISLSSNLSKLDTHWETAAQEAQYPGFAAACLVSYENLASSTKYFHGLGKSHPQAKDFQIISKVVTASVSNPNTTLLEKNVTFRFSHSEIPLRNGSPICVYWDESQQGGTWSDEGCTALKFTHRHTICSCSHLSSFAVLLALYDFKDTFQLQVITWVGLLLSQVCLVICIITFSCCRSIKCTRNTIHLHLCISLFMANLVFLAGISRTENRDGCALVAGLLHFFFLAAFCWMCLEGVQLYRMVVLVFNTTVRPLYLLAGGYGVPAFIVIISASVNPRGYGTERHCWLSLEKNFIWSFFGPVCVILVVNAIFFIITVWKLAEKFSSLNPDLSTLNKAKTFTITAIAQLCVLGMMWIFGCFQFDQSTLFTSYMFTIFNSLQGALVFVMHCLLSKQVRDEYRKFLHSVCTSQQKSYSDFSSNQTSNSQGMKSNQYTGESRI